MKPLLIAYYWYPWNNPGTFRWVGINKYLRADVLTSQRPVKSFYDETVPNNRTKIIRIGNNWIAKLWGIFAPILEIRFILKHKTIIITSPPEPLILWAYLLQLTGRTVILDLRDSFTREAMKMKILKPVYAFFYRMIKHKIVAFGFIDPAVTCIYSGHDDLERKASASVRPYYYGTNRRLSFQEYNNRLCEGSIPTMKNKPEGYCSSAVHNIKHLGYEIDTDKFHPEAYSSIPISHKQAAGMVRSYLYKIRTK